MQTIKSIARGRWSDPTTATQFSWYEPLTDPEAIARAVRFVLGNAGPVPEHEQRCHGCCRSPSLRHGVSSRSRPTPRWTPTSAEFGITPIFAEGALERI